MIPSRRINQEIIKNYRIICNAEPDNIENWLTLGRCLVEDEQYDEAEKALTKIFEEGRFFSFKNGRPRLRFKTLFGFFKNKLLFARAYSDMAMISLYQGNMAEAERRLTLAMCEFEKAKDDDEYAKAANRLGMVYRLAGAFESAEEMHYRAKDIAKKLNKNALLAETLGDLGMVYEGKDRFLVALEHHKESLKLYEADPNRAFEAACQKRQIGLCCLRANDFDQALIYLNASLDDFKNLGSYVFQSRLYNDLALVYQAQGDLDTAVEIAEKSVKAADLSQDGTEKADNRVLLACLEMARENLKDELESLLKDAVEYYKSADLKTQLANACSTLGLFYLRRKDWKQADSLFRDSLHLEEMLHRSFGMASDFGNLGLIAQKTGNHAKAAEYWHKAAVLFEEGGNDEMAEKFKTLCEEAKSDLEATLLRE